MGTLTGGGGTGTTGAGGETRKREVVEEDLDEDRREDPVEEREDESDDPVEDRKEDDEDEELKLDDEDAHTIEASQNRGSGTHTPRSVPRLNLSVYAQGPRLRHSD
ncbi:hypothetical protein A2635_03895 [Candidatus Peribacteria bacterium RIFCSPHIGHO2_01_FULL_51_9]|nr:MAG: hypothetical protein A2635_03895 [Candidatus Peribacteria bacterium RIFCSPHIGHO2_01_FULL_51_9]